jgi:NAD(P)-dependent dehydrogenase (short-subunit alcohol dehydrogenase family)
VFATVRREADGEGIEREAAGMLSPLIMDVRAAEEIARAAQVVRAHVADKGLDVLVNNAGFGVFEPVELVSMDKFRSQLDVNVTGQLAVTQAFLPLVRQASGRILMTGSVAGRITMPFAGPQAAAKRAVVALTEALRLELSAWGISVILIEPTTIRSAAIDKFERDLEVTLQSLDTRGRELYGSVLANAMQRALAVVRRGSDPDVVADTIARAVASRRPRARYLSGRHGYRLAILATLPPVVLDGIRRRLFGLPEHGSRKTETDPALLRG